MKAKYAAEIRAAIKHARDVKARRRTDRYAPPLDGISLYARSYWHEMDRHVRPPKPPILPAGAEFRPPGVSQLPQPVIPTKRGGIMTTDPYDVRLLETPVDTWANTILWKLAVATGMAKRESGKADVNPDEVLDKALDLIFLGERYG